MSQLVNFDSLDMPKSEVIFEYLVLIQQNKTGNINEIQEVFYDTFIKFGKLMSYFDETIAFHSEIETTVQYIDDLHCYAGGLYGLAEAIEAYLLGYYMKECEEKTVAAKEAYAKSKTAGMKGMTEALEKICKNLESRGFSYRPKISRKN